MLIIHRYLNLNLFLYRRHRHRIYYYPRTHHHHFEALAGPLTLPNPINLRLVRLMIVFFLLEITGSELNKKKKLKISMFVFSLLHFLKLFSRYFLKSLLRASSVKFPIGINAYLIISGPWIKYLYAFYS